MERASALLIPLLLVGVLLLGVFRRVAVYDAFVEGAAQGLKTALNVMPYLCAALLLVALLRSSGLLDILLFFLKKPMTALGLPEGTLPLLIMRPFSGSASLAVLEDIFKQYGADSHTGRVAALMMCSTETVLYTVAVYLGAAGIKKSRGIIPVALLSSLVGALAAGVFARLFWG